jgi:glycosyltransferase
VKISVITAVRNNRDFVGSAIRSLQAQEFQDFEHIVVDGASTDGTLEIVGGLADARTRILSEPDTGIYNAMNKGIAMATGEVVGFLHSDDIFDDGRVLGEVAARFASSSVQSCHGDLLYVDKIDTDKVVRRWRSCQPRPGTYLRGWMPPHPTVFVRASVYAAHGRYREDLRIAGDYEWILRVFHEKGLPSEYIPRTLTRMRVGGASNRSLRNLVRKSLEDVEAWRSNGHRWLGYGVVPLKNLRKLHQFAGSRA